VAWAGLLETLRTLGECHTQLRMNTTIFLDLHDLLVASYDLKPSMHMSTYEMLAIFLFICGGNESNRRTRNRFKHSRETISRKFNEVLYSFMANNPWLKKQRTPPRPAVGRSRRSGGRRFPYLKIRYLLHALSPFIPSSSLLVPCAKR
jgi:hypothetical protein